jgi:hypothetical protein
MLRRRRSERRQCHGTRFGAPRKLSLNDRQLARFSRIGNAFRDHRRAERYAAEEPQRSDDLAQRRPGYPGRDQMYLEGADVFQFQPIR